MFAIRKADQRDAKALADLAESTFRATFAGANTAEDTNLHCRASFGESIQAAEISDPQVVTLLSEDGGRMIGFAQVRWKQAPACVSAAQPGEIHRLYVHQDWHGKGVAQQLMKACLDELARRGSGVAWLGVWERNPRAIAFYGKFGFAEVGDHAFLVGSDAQRDIVMAKPLRPEPMG